MQGQRIFFKAKAFDLILQNFYIFHWILKFGI